MPAAADGSQPWRTRMLLASFALAALGALPQDPDETLPLLWDRALDVALAEAKKKKSFVFVALPVDYDGEGSGGLGTSFWRSKGLREALSKGHGVVGSTHKHSELEAGYDRDGKAVARVCSRFGQLVCDQHREVEKQVIARYFNGVEPPARPVFLVLRGLDGAVLARRAGDVTAPELAQVVQSATLFVDASPDAAVPADLLGRTKDADAAVRARALRVLATLEFPTAEAARKALFDEAKDDARRAELLNAIADVGSRM